MSGTQSDRAPEHVEKLIDKMSKDSFPASDPPQLQGFDQDGEPARSTALPVHPPTHAPPPEVALPEPDRSPFDREGRYELEGAGEVTIATEGQQVRIAFTDHPLTLDATALETLIALLERHRPALQRHQ
jgi:hypothetical protein